MTPLPDDRPPWVWPRAAYVHVPFCAHHCGYCDFAVAAGQDHLIDQYLDALAAELATLAQPQPVRTLFLGGGTPTHLAPPQLARLLREVRRWLPPLPDHEFSVEANPGTLDRDRLAVLADHGVNRISLGAQSFQAPLLGTLERDHRAEHIAVAVEIVRERIDNVSLDLIFGVPCQTLSQWQADLAAALALRPAHLSTYGLTYEKGTRFWKERQRGRMRPLGEEDELALYVCAMETLERAGLEQYEISSFALPGRRCRHNQVYWANEAYFGFGMGAARYVNGRREVNTRSLTGYLRRALAGAPVAQQGEELGPEERARETLGLLLRRAEGVVRAAFCCQTGFEVDALAGPALGRHAELGLLEDDGLSVRLTRRGRCVADAVIAAVL
jgi:oxygen-independent coproporphyrinogen-3 oxidase